MFRFVVPIVWRGCWSAVMFCQQDCLSRKFSMNVYENFLPSNRQH